MRKVLLWSLLALVPSTNLRMICFDHAGSGAAVQAGAAQGPECTDFCNREQAPAQETESDTGCVLVADGCSVLTSLVLSVSAPAPGLGSAAPARFAAPEPQHLYLSPTLDVSVLLRNRSDLPLSVSLVRRGPPFRAGPSGIHAPRIQTDSQETEGS